MLARPARLTLAAEGVTVTTQWGRAQLIPWSGPVVFRVAHRGRWFKVVLVDSPAIAHRHPRGSRLARALTGGNGQIQPGYGRLSADDLAMTLNRYIAHYGVDMHGGLNDSRTQ